MGKYGAVEAATSTELLALIASQVNVSSIGDTYTDTAGDTYAETASQTRMTMDAARRRVINMSLTGHVDAGTGTYQLYNNTDATSLATATTTSTSEALIAVQNSLAATNLGDVITIRVKNSGVGGQTTIDAGGMLDGDGQVQTVTAVGFSSAVLMLGTTIYPSYPTSVRVAVVRRPSTGTITVNIAIVHNSGNAVQEAVAIGSSFGTSQANTVVTVTPTVKVSVPASWQLNCTAIGASNSWTFSSAAQWKADDI